LIKADISTIEGMDQIYDMIKREHGGSLYVLVNNAGVAIDNPIFNASIEEFEKTVNINLRSAWYLTKRLSRFMIRQRAGRIINISSVVGCAGNVAQSIYGMTKAAMNNLTMTASKEFAQYGILVNAVAPGFIRTSMTEKIPEEFAEVFMKQIPLGRMGNPEEVGEVVQFLATSANYCTGSIFHVNGGMYGG
jgi:3-oxoacyl-[acyl-carrier protein] reductase